MSKRGKIKLLRNYINKKGDNKYDNPESLTLLDVQCTVCVGIFIEPVTLPCHHSVCKECFERTIDNNSLACPICRKYVGCWVRHRKKDGLLVNQKLWSHISSRFRPHVEKKLNGEDDEAIDELNHTPSPRVSEPGSIRLEYEAEQKRIWQEISARQQKEALASEKLIEEIQQQEEEERKHLEELRKKAEEEDAMIAKQIAAQLAAEETKEGPDENQVPSAFVPLSPQSLPSTSQGPTKGPMDAFLSQSSVRVPRAESSSSTDSFRNEVHHFRPLDIAPKTPPKKSAGGKVQQISPIRKPIPVMRSLDGWSSCGANSLRPWMQRTKSSEMIRSSTDPGGTYDASVAAVNSLSGEKRPSEDELKNSSKKFRSLSQSKSLRSYSENLMLVSKSSSNNCKRDLIISESSDSDSDIDADGENERSAVRKSNASFNATVSNNVNDSSLTKTDSVASNSFDIHSALIPLSLDELSEQAQVEQRFQQQQADYEFALKLQNELNAIESQNRSYELRSIVSLSPKKSTAKVTPPRSKLKSKPTSSSKKGRGRQCTLEETLSFSVKMKL